MYESVRHLYYFRFIYFYIYKHIHDVYILLPGTSNPVQNVTTYRYCLAQNLCGVGGNRPTAAKEDSCLEWHHSTTEHEIVMIEQSLSRSQAFSFYKQHCMASKDANFTVNGALACYMPGATQHKALSSCVCLG